MFAMFVCGVLVCWKAESSGNPIHQKLGVAAADGNMEGKEVRFGIFNSALFATITTDASCGAVNAMHDSFTPLGGLVPLFNIETGEVIFGGVGAGLYGMLIFVVLAVFIAGLMVGRTPEYLGKKIEAYDVKLVMLVLMVLSATILGFTAWASVTDWGQAGLNNAGPHGFSEILYAFSSCVGNNGSAFAGLTAAPADGNPHWDTTLGIAARRALPHDRPHPRPRRQPRRKEAHPAERRHVQDRGRDVHRPPHRHRRPRRRAHVPARPGGRTRSSSTTSWAPAPCSEPRSPHPSTRPSPTMSTKSISLFDRDIMQKAIVDSFKKLNPRQQLKNPVMFVTLVGAVLTFQQLFTAKEPFGYVLQIALWLLFTVSSPTSRRRWRRAAARRRPALRKPPQAACRQAPRKDGERRESVDASQLRKGDVVGVHGRRADPGDGEVIEGAASVDESAITGESAPVIREAGGDRSAVTGGTRVLSDRIVIRITANPARGSSTA
jgi:hypothetical protein